MEDIAKTNRVKWTRRMERFLNRNFSLISMAEIADGLGIPVEKVTSKAKRMGLRREIFHEWTESELRWLKENYPNMFNEDIAAFLGIPLNGVYSKASRLGLRKSDAFRAEMEKRRVKGIKDKAQWRRRQIMELAKPPADERKEE